MATEITERQARQVAEEAREGEWKLPSFGKELFLGNLRLDLIHPQPRLDDAAVEKGERFLAELRAFLTEHVDPLQIERDAEDPRRGHRRPQGARRARHEGARAVRRARPLAGLLQPRAGAGRLVARRRSRRCCRAHQSIGVAEPLLLFGTEEQKRALAAAGRAHAHLRVPAHRARRRLRPGAARRHRDADRGRHGLPAQRHQAVGDQRRDRRHRRGDGEGARARGGITAFVLPVRHRRRDRRAPQRVHGPARDRELGDAARRTSSCRRRT